MPPAGKFSLRSIACLTLLGRRARDRRGPRREEKDLESSAGSGGGGRSRLLTWATRNGPGLRLAAPGAARERGAHHCLGRCPRPCPRRLLFLPRARHVTAIKHVCALHRGDFLILRRSRAPRTRPRRRSRTHRHCHPPSRRQTPAGLRPAPGRARAGGAAGAARHALVPSALHTRASPPPPPAPPPDLWPCQTFFFSGLIGVQLPSASIPQAAPPAPCSPPSAANSNPDKNNNVIQAAGANADTRTRRSPAGTGNRRERPDRSAGVSWSPHRCDPPGAVSLCPGRAAWCRAPGAL